MKSPGLLKFSLALNLLLVSAWFALSSKPAPPPSPETNPFAPPPILVANPDAASTNASAPIVAKFEWRLVESADYRQYITNLRGIRCPERLICDIIIADVEKLYEGKATALNATPINFEPWIGREHREAAGREREAQANALEAEKHALIKELLGVDWDADADREWQHEAIVGFLLGYLSDEKAPFVMAWVKAGEEKAQAVRRAANGILIEEDYTRLHAIADEQMAQLAQTLTPPELDELRRRAQLFVFDGDIRLDGVALSGLEFRELAGLSFTLTDFLREKLVIQESPGEEEEARRKTLFEQQVANLLGPQRFADYQLAQDAYFCNAFAFTKEHNLAKSAAVKLAESVRSAQAQAQEIKQDKTLSADEQKLALQVLQAATRNTISATLGAAFPDYEKGNAAGLQIVPPEKPPGGKR